MRVTLTPKAAGWRGRGRPPEQIDPEILALLTATYQTGNMGRIDPTDDPAGAEELLHLLRSGANQQGKRLTIQRDHDEIRFVMTDRGAK